MSDVSTSGVVKTREVDAVAEKVKGEPMEQISQSSLYRFF